MKKTLVARVRTLKDSLFYHGNLVIIEAFTPDFDEIVERLSEVSGYVRVVPCTGRLEGTRSATFYL